MQRMAIRLRALPNQQLVTSLHPWLNGQWALLLSHPEDFYWSGLESDRWLVLLENALVAAKLKPLTFASERFDDYGWFASIGGAQIVLHSVTDMPSLKRIDPRVRRFTRTIPRESNRFAMILDALAYPRWECTYSLPKRAIPIFDLIAIAENLRNKAPIGLASLRSTG